MRSLRLTSICRRGGYYCCTIQDVVTERAVDQRPIEYRFAAAGLESSHKSYEY